MSEGIRKELENEKKVLREEQKELVEDKNRLNTLIKKMRKLKLYIKVLLIGMVLGIVGMSVYTFIKNINSEKDQVEIVK